MSARKSILAGLASLCALWGVFALAGASANAAAIHSYLSQITEVPAGAGVSAPGPFALMESTTVDSGHLWVAEQFNGGSRADEFNASTGAFISQIVPPASLAFRREGGGIAVGHVTGATRIYAGATNSGSESVVAVFDEAGTLQASPWTGAGTPAKSFGSGLIEVAVDNSASLSDPAAGDVYVVVEEQKVIDVFHPEADGEEHYVGQITSLTGPYRIAVNESNGDLIVLNEAGSDTIDVLEPATLGEYTLVREITSLAPGTPLSQTFNIAVDNNTGDIYATEGIQPTPTVIDEFSSTGVYLGHIVGEDSPGGNILGVYSLTVGVSGEIYIADDRRNGFGELVGKPAVKVFEPDKTVPDVGTGAVANLKARSGTLTGTVNPDKAGAATCQFVWGTSTEFGHTAACSGPVAQGESPVPVQAQLSGLEPDTTYYYLLQATDAQGTNVGEPFQIEHFTTPGPKLDAEAVSAVTADSATFDATIDPHNVRTTYYFQYGTTSNYGANVPAPPGLELGAGEGDVESSQHVQRLSVNTVYHYRVVAISEVDHGATEEFDGPDQTFTTQTTASAPGLPDGRMYELVTPAAKEGALIFGPNWRNVEFGSADPLTGQAAADGSGIVDVASRPTEAEPSGNAVEVAVLSTRGSGGWSSQVIAPPHKEATFISISNGGEYRFFSEDLSMGIVDPFGNFMPLAPGATESTPYLRSEFVSGDQEMHCQSSCFQPLVTASNTPAGTVFGEELPNGACPHIVCGPLFVDATPDLSHVILSSPAQLTSVPAPKGGLYEWSAGRLQLISQPPEGQAGILRLAGASVRLEVQTQPTRSEYGARHAISDDGERVVLVGRGLYLRDVGTGQLVRLDVAQGGASVSENPEYMTASTDVSRIFFLDKAGLTRESSASGTDLYEYDLNAPPGERLTDLTVDANAGEQADVTSVLGASEDGSYVYFVANGALTAGARNGHCAQNGFGVGPLCNLYVRHDGATRLVAAGWNAEHGGEQTARVSPDGRWLAFMSDQDLTGYDTRDAVSGQLDQEVYLYDAREATLVCASCNPSGSRPVGAQISHADLVGGSLKEGTWAAANVVPGTRSDGLNSLYESRYLSDAGRLFFDSNDALVPQDVNGTQDVYEYESAGIGTCGASSVTFDVRTNGCVGLISSGASAEESAFMDASETSGDVFFSTSAKLVSQDFDNALDVYDAHECSTGVPCYPVAAVASPVCSTGDACKAAPTPQPSIFGSAPSATFSGVGNVTVSRQGAGVKRKSLTRAQKLTRALRGCRMKGGGRRAVCERSARRRFGAVGKSKVGAKRKGRG